MISASGISYFRICRVSLIISCAWKMPRRVSVSFIRSPMFSFGQMISILTIGSRMPLMRDPSGRSAGLWISTCVPSLRSTLYDTVGAVCTIDTPPSRSRRSCTMSMCRRPRNPQRKPKPSASLCCGSKVKLASFRCSFSIASRSCSKSDFLPSSSALDG